MMTILQIKQEIDYNNVVSTIVLILIIGRMIDRFVNGDKNNNN